jgi:murein DD-endopeptidase MepM/ murein hydrolase activator NlpD
MELPLRHFLHLGLATFLVGLAVLPSDAQSGRTGLCPAPALSRVVRHRVAAGETLQSIAQKYNLIPATLMGLNPALRGGTVTVGMDILVPPGNGIRVEVPPGQTIRDLAKTYKVRADLLFEVNGCQPNPRVVFVPGVNWSPVGAATQVIPADTSQILAGYPLAIARSESALLMGYGYTVQAGAAQSRFHSGIDLAAPVGMAVLAAGNGTVAFAGVQGAYGKLVVVNHAEGLQTRYAQLASIEVKVGQAVRLGQTLGTVGTSGRPSSTDPHLHFEVRSRSNLGWVAENPTLVLFKRSP